MLFRSQHVKTLGPMVTCLKDPHPAVRVQAAEALGHFQDRRLVPCLIAVLDDPDEQLVGQAAASLGRIGAPEAHAPLLRLTGDARPAVRRAAARALGELSLGDGDEASAVS